MLFTQFVNTKSTLVKIFLQSTTIIFLLPIILIDTFLYLSKKKSGYRKLLLVKFDIEGKKPLYEYEAPKESDTSYGWLMFKALFVVALMGGGFYLFFKFFLFRRIDS